MKEKDKNTNVWSQGTSESGNTDVLLYLYFDKK